MARNNSLAPQKGKQEIAAQTNVDVMIYGGAAGCVDKDTEFLSPKGWKKISDYVEDDLVMQVDPYTFKASFCYPLEYHKIPCEHLTRFVGKGVDQCLSDEHKVLYYNDYSLDKPKTISFKEMKQRHEKSKTKGFSGRFLTSYDYGGNGIDYSEGELRLQVAVMADGRIVKEGKDNCCQMRFAKERKYDRLLDLCKKYNLRHDDRGWKESERYSSGKEYEVIVYPKTRDKLFDSKYFNCSKEQLEIIYDEIFHWDGSFAGTTTKRYFSIHKQNADFIQFVCNSLGYNAGISFDKRDGKNCYTVNTYTTGKGYRGIANKDGKIPMEQYKTLDGFKYCFTVTTGFFLIRRNNKVVVTGNSGKSRLLLLKAGYYAHNDPNFEGVMFRRTSPPLKAAGGLFTEAKKLYNPLGCKIREKDMEILFYGADTKKGGGNLKFTHLEHVNDAEGNH